MLKYHRLGLYYLQHIYFLDERSKEMSIARRVVPSYMRVPVNSKRKLTFLGWWNLRYLLHFWEIERQDTNVKITDLKKELCHINATQEVTYRTAKQIEQELRAAEAEHNRIGQNIAYIIKVMEKAEIKPPFSTWRPKGYFFLSQTVYYLIPKEGFVLAKVVDKTDSTITIEYHNAKEHRTRCKSNSNILSQWALHYLRNNPKYRELWLKVSNAQYTPPYFLKS